MAACEGGDTETAFVLQHRPWGERDLSVELYAARRGRLVARLYGGQNAHSKRRAALVAFAELQVTLA
ncbi:MAG: recombination protein O N-terminal domain-containing protein, partial [Polyangiales bacterium]